MACDDGSDFRPTRPSPAIERACSRHLDAAPNPRRRLRNTPLRPVRLTILLWAGGPPAYGRASSRQIPTPCATVSHAAPAARSTNETTPDSAVIGRPRWCCVAELRSRRTVHSSHIVSIALAISVPIAYFFVGKRPGHAVQHLQCGTILLLIAAVPMLVANGLYLSYKSADGAAGDIGGILIMLLGWGAVTGTSASLINSSSSAPRIKAAR